MVLNVFEAKKWVVVWTFWLTKPHVFVCFFPCMLCNSSCYDFYETNKVLSYEWVIISVSLKFFQNLELFIIWVSYHLSGKWLYPNCNFSENRLSVQNSLKLDQNTRNSWNFLLIEEFLRKLFRAKMLWTPSF